MKGKELLDNEIGHCLQASKVQSFYLNGELVERITVTFLKFNHWLRIVSSEEQTDICIASGDIENITLLGDKEFVYPIEQTERHFPEFSKYYNRKLEGYKELVWNKNEQMSFGVNLYFENGLNLIIHNNTRADTQEFIFENHLPKDLKEK